MLSKTNVGIFVTRQAHFHLKNRNPLEWRQRQKDEYLASAQQCSDPSQNDSTDRSTIKTIIWNLIPTVHNTHAKKRNQKNTERKIWSGTSCDFHQSARSLLSWLRDHTNIYESIPKIIKTGVAVCPESMKYLNGASSEAARYVNRYSCCTPPLLNKQKRA